MRRWSGWSAGRRWCSSSQRGLCGEDATEKLPTSTTRGPTAAILAHREIAPLLSNEHFSVEGILIKARASTKNFQQKLEAAPPDEEDSYGPPAYAAAEDAFLDAAPKTDPIPRPDRNVEVNVRGEKRSNATNASTTDPDARLDKKSLGAPARCSVSWAMR